MKPNILYGSLGFVSMLGLIGLFSEHRGFLFFFAFAVDFEYFFLPADEMLETYVNRSAARGFFAGMLTCAAAALFRFFAGAEGHAALAEGFAWGWGAASAVYALSTAYYGFKEKWGALA